MSRVATFRELFAADSDPSVPPLEVAGLRVQFGGLAAVRDVDFTMRAHEMMAVVGQNGAGKSTLLNAISGLVPATSASRIVLSGRVLHGRPAWRRARAGLGRAFQDPPLVDAISIRDNLLVGADTVTKDRSAAHERADFLLSLIGLDGMAAEYAGGLPYGARKLIDIARALMGRPELLLLDEPTSGLDNDEQRVVKSILRLVREAECTTVLMVEHHMNLVRSVSDRVLVLDAGSLVALASPGVALAGGSPAPSVGATQEVSP